MIEAIDLTRIIRAPRTRVFEAWTNAEHIKKWWGPGTVTCPEAEIDLKPGGKYRIGNLQDDGRTVWIEGEFVSVTPPEQVVYSWIIGGAADDASQVTVDFHEHDEGTRLVLTHERIPTEDHRSSHLMGWNGCLDGLIEYLEK